MIELLQVRPPRVKVYKVIAGANRNCLPELSKKVLCLQLLYLRLTDAAPCSFWLLMALLTLPKHSSSVQCFGLSHQRQVWKNALRCDWPHRALSSLKPLRAIESQELRFMHSTCLRRIHGRKLGSILPFIKGRMPPKPTGEKRTAFCPSPIQNSTPKNYNRASLNYGTLSQAIPQFLGHYGISTSASFAVLLAPPSDPFGIYEVWGSTCFLSLPLPWIPSGSQGMGHIEVDGNSRLIYLEETCASRNKKTNWI